MLLSEEAFLHVAPFHLVWGADGHLERISPSLRRLWHLSDTESPQVLLERPFPAVLDVTWFPEITDMVLTLVCPSVPDRMIRGELIPLPKHRWLLCALPPMGRVSDLEKAGLKLSDLPLHTGLGDALIAAEAAHVSLGEARRALAGLQTLNKSLMEMNEAFGRFVPKPFLAALGMQSPVEAALGVRASAHTTVMFADLRNFTTISEQLGAEEIFSFINRYLAQVAPRIRENEGFVVHYLGDGILALFNGAPELSVRAAVEMQKTLKEAIHGEGLGACLPPGTDISLGIGLHYGHIQMGIIGESGRWDSTIISDAVNTASRVEGLTKVFGAEILITGQLGNQLSEIFRTRRLGRMSVKGRAEQLDVYEVLDSLDPETLAARLANAETFDAAVRAFEAGDLETAAAGFEACLAVDPNDRATLHYHSHYSCS